MRAFDLVQNFLTLLVIPFLATVVGVAAIPAVWFFLEVRAILVNESEFIELIGTGIILGMSSMMWGISLVLLCGFLGGAFRPRLETGRYPLRSFVTIQWAWSILKGLFGLQWSIHPPRNLTSPLAAQAATTPPRAHLIQSSNGYLCRVGLGSQIWRSLLDGRY